MADLIELEQWELGVYQLETEDPVLGGPEGIDNLQAKQLANRTKYLKAQLLLRALIDSPAFTGNPTAPTPAPGDNDASIATTAFVQAAITALINSSPAALDTLNELAAALGNDADFATTITNALALKAPLNSPVLTGDPKAPTPALGDNDTSIATTEFVQAAIAALSNTGDYKASVRVASTAAINLAAPGANIDGVAMVAGDRFLEKDNATAADRGIYIWNGAAVPATRALDADTGAEFNGGAIIPVEEGTANADTNWQVTNDGVVTIGTTGLTFKEVAAQNFATNAEAQAFVVTNKAISPATLAAALQGANQSLVTSGYQKLPGGFILQWARPILAPNGFVTVTFPITFPNQALHIVASNSDGTASLYSIEAHVVSTSQAQIYQNSSTNRGVTYFVIGN